MKRNLETICIHGGWQPKKVNLSSYPFIRVQLLDMKAVNNGTFV